MTIAQKLISAAALSLASGSAVRADVTLHHLFGDHGVVQRDKPLPVWGTARANDAVTVTLGSQT